MNSSGLAFPGQEHGPGGCHAIDLEISLGFSVGSAGWQCLLSEPGPNAAPDHSSESTSLGEEWNLGNAGIEAN